MKKPKEIGSRVDYSGNYVLVEIPIDYAKNIPSLLSGLYLDICVDGYKTRCPHLDFTVLNKLAEAIYEGYKTQMELEIVMQKEQERQNER